MIFSETPLQGAFVIEPAPRTDERGFFARVWCQHEFEEKGLTARVAQANLSLSKTKGMIRGMHYQIPPHAEAKTVRCTQGAIHDVIIDLRPSSPTYCAWFGVDLTADNHRMLYVPEGFAHGFQTLSDEAVVTYLVSEFYAPGFEQGVRFDDPIFGIEWPLAVTVVSDKDRGWPNYVRHDATTWAVR